MEIKILPLLLNVYGTSLTPSKSLHIITGGGIVHNDNHLPFLHLIQCLFCSDDRLGTGKTSTINYWHFHFLRFIINRLKKEVKLIFLLSSSSIDISDKLEHLNISSERTRREPLSFFGNLEDGLDGGFNVCFGVENTQSKSDRSLWKSPDGVMGCRCTMKSWTAENAELLF